MKPFLILMRPANIITAIADILAGISIAGLLATHFNSSDTISLIIATIGLYGGGVVFNDVFDYELDKIERPERPLPSGQVSLKQGMLLGIFLLLMGVLAALNVSIHSGLIAGLVAILALTYNKFSKHSLFLGPLNMGLCRSFNLLLGLSVSISALFDYWYLAFIPLIFIGDITLTSQGEVKGKNKGALYVALGLDFLVLGIFIILHFFTKYNVSIALPFLAFWFLMNGISKIKAIQENRPKMIQNAVKMGVLSLIPLNAAIAAGFEGWIIGLIVLLLLPFSLALAKYFSVT